MNRFSDILKFAIMILAIISIFGLLRCMKIYPKSVNLQNFHVDVIRVIDGDTIVFDYQKLPIIVRLKGIDTFETKLNKHLRKQQKQFGYSDEEIIRRGMMAKQFVRRNLKLGNTYCIQIDINHPFGYYGRYIADVYTNNMCKGKTLSNMLLENFLAFKYKK